MGGVWVHRLGAGLASKMERLRLESSSPGGCRLPDGRVVRSQPRDGWLQIVLSVDPRRWKEEAEWVACPSCGGSGAAGPERTCRRCGATGRVSSHVLMVEELRRLLLRRAKEWSFPGIPVAGVTFVHPFRDDTEPEREGDGTPVVCGPSCPEYTVHGPHIHAFVLALDIREDATPRYYERTTERCERHAGLRWGDLEARVRECPDCREGHIVKIVTVDGEPGSPFKLYSGYELEKALVYELSHVAVLKGKHSVTEFGVLKLLPTPEEEPEALVCPEHGVEMTARPPTAETFAALTVRWAHSGPEAPGEATGPPEDGPPPRLPVVFHRLPGADAWRPVRRGWDLDNRDERGRPLALTARALALELKVRSPDPPPGFRDLARQFSEDLDSVDRLRLEAAEYRASHGRRARRRGP